MSASIARSTVTNALAKRAIMKPFLAVRAYGTSWAPSREEDAPDYRSLHDSTSSDYQYSSFENNLERVLEMAQLGKEPQETTFWEQAVRSAYKRRGIASPIAYI
jgi:ribosomal protein S18 acetylase RimI-like enzyme